VLNVPGATGVPGAGRAGAAAACQVKATKSRGHRKLTSQAPSVKPPQRKNRRTCRLSDAGSGAHQAAHESPGSMSAGVFDPSVPAFERHTCFHAQIAKKGVNIHHQCIALHRRSVIIPP
jgi:hypothetical protein